MKTLLNIAARAPMWVRWAICLVYGLLLMGLSLAPPSAFPDKLIRLPNADKVMHFLMYGGFAVLLRWPLGAGVRLTVAVTVFATLIGYGLLMEIMQKYLTGSTRSFSWADVVFNAAGVLICWQISGWCLKRRHRTRIC